MPNCHVLTLAIPLFLAMLECATSAHVQLIQVELSLIMAVP